MEWWLFIALFVGTLLAFMLLGVSIAFSFLAVNMVFVTIVMGFNGGSKQLVFSFYDSLTNFTLTSVVAFLLMGEILFQSKVVTRSMDVLSKMLGALPGRLSVLAVGAGTIFAALNGSAMANTAMLGSTLVPDMRQRGYSKSMSVGPVMAAGGLAMIIPPSSIAILLGTIGGISVKNLLIGGIIPGLILALFFLGYIIISCTINPSLAPTYEVDSVKLSEKLLLFMKDVVPLIALIVIILLIMFLGYATPTESAAIGTVGAFILVACYGKLNLQLLIKSLKETLKVTAMILLIMATANSFAQLLSFTGAAREFVEVMLSIDVASIWIIILMQVVVLILGFFLEQTSIMLITLPLFMPIVNELGFDPLVFGILMLINLSIAAITPPFGLVLYVAKGVVPPDFTMQDIMKAAVPYVVLNLAAIALLLAFPEIITWLPGLNK